MGKSRLKFIVVDTESECIRPSTVYLILTKWDDWFTYSTLFRVIYVNGEGNKISLHTVKIGQKGQNRSPQLPKEFIKLGEEYFSLGGDEDYYIAINKISPKGNLREKILKGLNDIALDIDKYNEVVSLNVTTTSLMRDKTANMVKNQYHRMAEGGAWLTNYSFTYTFPQIEVSEIPVEIDFEVVPEVLPPTNIHVLIGKNGVGKTTLLRNIIYAIESDNEQEQYGYIDTNKFANLVYVSFSAFDEYVDLSEESIPFLYIGLFSNQGIMALEEMCEKFAESLFEITRGSKKKLWIKSIKALESDNTFEELNISSWISGEYNEADQDITNLKKQYPQDFDEQRANYIKRILKIKFMQEIVPKFKKLSSGHKVILLTIVKLIDTVEEKTLVLLDEPEEHLHPPLVSAFIRTLSELLVYRNGVGIIATHSPVIVQEVPKSCVWILRRTGNQIVADRPQGETFGENLGVLTSEIFGYEVTNSGFHKMINDAVEKHASYKGAIRYFHNNLGDEGRTILRSLMYKKENAEENDD